MAEENEVSNIEPKRSAVEEYQSSRAAFMQAQKELAERLNQKLQPVQQDPSELLWRISKAFFTPTPTGAFGESLGNVSGAVVEQREAERKRREAQANQAVEIAKMRLELGQGQLEQSRQSIIEELSPSLYKTNEETGLPEVNVEVAQKLAGVTKDPKYLELVNQQAKRNQAIKLFSGATGAIPGGAVSPQQASNLSPELVSKIKLADKEVGQIAEDQFKNFIALQTQNVEQAKLQATIAGLVAQYGPGVMQYIPGAPQAAPKAPSAPADVSTPPTAPKPSVATPRAGTGLPMAAEAKAKEAGAGELEKGAADRTNAFIDSASDASNKLNVAQSMIDIAKTNPNAFGVLEKPGVGSAVLGAIRDGVSVGQFGSAGLKSIEDAVRKIGSGTYKDLPPAQRNAAIQRDIDAARMFATYASQLELAYAKMYLKGQGAVTENERAIVRAIGPNVSDTPQVIQNKAKFVALGAQKEQAMLEAFRQFQDEQGKYATLDQFQRSQQYKSIADRFNSEFGELRKQIAGGGKRGPVSQSLDDVLKSRGL